MDNPLQPGTNNADVIETLTDLPDLVADSLETWRIATLNRERAEALLFLRFRAEQDRTVQEIKSLVNSDPERYEAVLNEIKTESLYNRLYEKLLSAKKIASLRTAY